MRYLLQTDPDVGDIIRNKRGVKVYFQLFLFAFGLFQNTIEEIQEFEENINQFRNSKEESVYCLFLGVVNHWITMICYKERGNQEIKFYFLDSSNLHFLDKNDEQIPDVLENRNRIK